MTDPDLHTLAAEAIARAEPHLPDLYDDYDDLAALYREISTAVLAAVLPEHRRKVLAADQPEPCPLDHSCDEGDSCGCWCPLHDCAITECPTFRTVERWIADMRERHEAILACHREQVLAEAADVFEAYADNYPDDVFPTDSRTTDGIAGTAMRHAYRVVARTLRDAAQPPAAPAESHRAARNGPGAGHGSNDGVAALSDAHRPVTVAEYQDVIEAISDALLRIRRLAINADAVVNGWNLDPQKILDILPDFAGTSDRVPLADVLDALRDEGALLRWYQTHHPDKYVNLHAAGRLADYLADRFAAPQDTDERTGSDA